MFEDKIHPAHGLYNARFFLNRNILRVNNLAVKLVYKPKRKGVEDVGHPGYDYTLTRADDGRTMRATGLDSYWRPQCGPDQVDWKSVALSISANEDNDLFVPPYVFFSLYGLENCSVVKNGTLCLWARFTSSDDTGFFPADSLVVREFKRRLAIENAENRIEDAKKTLEKHRALGPYMTD